MTLTLDSSKFEARVAEMKKRTADAGLAALAVYGNHLVDNIARIAPRDTNRYVAGWIKAGNAAGVSDLTPPTLHKSSKHDKYLQALREQITMLEKQMDRWIWGMENWYWNHPSRPRKGWYRKAEAQVRKLGKRLQRALEELAKAEGDELFLFFDAGAFVERKNKRRLSTVRTKIYGGEGRLFMNGETPRLELHNKEPHTTIVEARFGVVAVAARGTRALGTRKASKAYIAAIQGVVGAANATQGITTRTRPGARGGGVQTTA